MLLCLLILAFFLSCEPSPPSPFEKVRLSLAPEAHDIQNLAFTILSEVPCESIYVELHTPQNQGQPMWHAHTRDSGGMPCPNPLRWGEALAEGWDVTQTPRPLSSNRLYFLKIGTTEHLDGVGLAFCAFQDGSLVSNASLAVTQELKNCIHENISVDIEAPSEEKAEEAKPPGDTPEARLLGQNTLGVQPRLTPLEPKVWEASLEEEVLDGEEEGEEAEEDEA
ncbi:MAG: hypothetical protein FWC28_00800 [Proteobacteria bacterium]|nr:hypothetical protein [Cystobacterineae bacterium]MCL2313781.1 hypothetical protein [Pseudomonadota bacterium]